jgi:uncharacterized protein (TIGR03437 family)
MIMKKLYLLSISLILSAAAIPATAQTLTTVAHFDDPSGRIPLVKGADGNIYGASASAVFRMTPGGALTTLHTFTGPDGSSPLAGVTFGADGNLYGVSEFGGTQGLGAIVRITPSGGYTILHNFDVTEGCFPSRRLIQAKDGNFYGTTYGYGAWGFGVGPCTDTNSWYGTVFRMSPDGSVTTLHHFTAETGSAFPNTQLVESADGVLYGMTAGLNETGRYAGIFRITPAGDYAMLHTFSFDGSEGHEPGDLVPGADGNLYGCTEKAFFRVNPTGTLTILWEPDDPQTIDDLITGMDGNFYGLTHGNVYGQTQHTVFQVTPAGKMTALTTTETDVYANQNNLVQGADGIYGILAASGGNTYDVSVFRVAVPPPAAAPPPFISRNAIVPLNSSSPRVQQGEWVSIYGSDLAKSTVVWNGDFPTSLGGTSVTFDGKPAYLWFVSPGQINLQVPDGMHSDPVPVVVTTANGSYQSAVNASYAGPSFNLLDGEHVAGIILRSDGSGAYGGGTYDILGPTGTSLGYPTVAAKADDTVELFGVGFGPTDPEVPAGQAFSGAAPVSFGISLAINNVKVAPSFTGLVGAGLYQINVTIPPGLGSGDVSLQVTTYDGQQTPSGVVMPLQ